MYTSDKRVLDRNASDFLMHENTIDTVISNGTMSEPFLAAFGMKQGCALAPILFNIFLVAMNPLTYQNNVGIHLSYRYDGGYVQLTEV